MNSTAAARVLVIDDEEKIASWLSTFLRQSNFEVITAPTGMAGLALAESEQPDVVLLDLMLPDMDGLDVCRVIRRRSDVLILMLTARIEDTDRLIGLEVGADDYITKPFNPREVIARIRAFLRRANGMLALEPKMLTYRGLSLNPNARTCQINGVPVPLTPTEFQILELLMKRPGIAFTREQLISEALGYDYAAYERTIDAHVRNIRRKIEPDMADPIYILTVFGVGYRFAGRDD
jgi:two-component system alkaline phosphatase synthesis response regulator PhoP